MIPVVDFSAYGLGVADPSTVGPDKLRGVADAIHQAFSTVGFCYLSNHGISDDFIQDFRSVSKKFFELPIETKERYVRKPDHNHGWVRKEMESLNPDRPGDLKEAFNFTPSDQCTNWPEFMPELEGSFNEFFQRGQELVNRVLDVMAIGLNLEDRNFLRDCHKLAGHVGNPSTVRSLFYPPLPESTDIKAGQVRCGEHSDYGTITLLFQDAVGGLEVRGVDGVYVSANPIPGTVLVNIGDLMQRWTSDRLLATKHRVLIPEDDLGKRKVRQSVAFFAHPDDKCMIKCLDGSDKYEPISSIDYINQRFGVTY